VSGHQRLAGRRQLPQKTDPDAGRLLGVVTDGIGGSPYGPGTLAGTDGSRQPVEAELTTARNLGSRLARVASRLKDLRVSRAAAP
jgi:multimeric flavodoxin WrbA